MSLASDISINNGQPMGGPSQLDATSRDVNTHIFGIDILRIVAMLMVISLHILEHGRAFDSLGSSNWVNKLARCFRAEHLCAVDLFMATTGWLLVKKPFRLKRLSELAIQVFSISLIIWIVALVFFEQRVSWLSFFADSWYWNCYITIILLSPIINIGLQGLHSAWKKQSGWILLACLAASIYLLPFKVEKSSPGYSVVWMLVCYLFGAWSRLSIGIIRNSATRWTIEAIALLLPILAVGISYGLLLIGVKAFSLAEHYHSPLILGCALCHLLFFTSIPITRLPKLLRLAADVSFGVYLIHENPIARVWYLNDRFSCLETSSFLDFVVCIWTAAIIIYLCCAVLELIRFLLFKLLGRTLSALKQSFQPTNRCLQTN